MLDLSNSQPGKKYNYGKAVHTKIITVTTVSLPCPLHPSPHPRPHPCSAYQTHNHQQSATREGDNMDYLEGRHHFTPALNTWLHLKLLRQIGHDTRSRPDRLLELVWLGRGGLARSVILPHGRRFENLWLSPGPIWSGWAGRRLTRWLRPISTPSWDQGDRRRLAATFTRLRPSCWLGWIKSVWLLLLLFILTLNLISCLLQNLLRQGDWLGRLN